MGLHRRWFMLCLDGRYGSEIKSSFIISVFLWYTLLSSSSEHFPTHNFRERAEIQAHNAVIARLPSHSQPFLCVCAAHLPRCSVFNLSQSSNCNYWSWHFSNSCESERMAALHWICTNCLQHPNICEICIAVWKPFQVQLAGRENKRMKKTRSFRKLIFFRSFLLLALV